MSLGQQTRVFIRSVGSYLPPRVVKNEDFMQWMDTSDEWIQQRTGIKERRWAAEGQCTSDLALEACNQALHRAQLKASDLDIILVATLSPDIFFPGLASILGEKLSAGTVPAMDIRCQCSGFLYSLATAAAFIRSGFYRRILVVGAELQSKALDLSTKGRDLAVLFGDGAGAVVVEASDDPSRSSDLLGFELHSEGAYSDKLAVIYPTTRQPHMFRNELADREEIYPVMEGRTVFKHAVARLPEVVASLAQRQQISLDKVDHFFFHQANLRINEAAAKALQIDPSKIWTNIERYGNTSAASIVICLAEAAEAGKLKRGDLCCLAGFGAGFTWGAIFLRW